MYVVNGQCLLSGSPDLALSAAIYQSSFIDYPGMTTQSVSLTGPDSFTVLVGRGGTASPISISGNLISATSHQCALPGPFVWLPPEAFDILVYAIPGLILTLMLIKLIHRA